VWPEEREDLIAAARRTAATAGEGANGLARVVAVFGSRGGAGATFIATHVAAAFARRGRDCVLVDIDPAFDDVGAALSVPADEPVPTIEDLVATSDEPVGGHHRPWTHPAGFRVIPGAVEPGRGALDPADVVAAVDSVARASQVVVCHVPRAVTELTRAVLARADVVIVVLTLEVASFRAAKRVVEALDLDERCRYVVNKATRADVSVADVERVFGRSSLAVIPAAAAVRAAQDRGQLLAPRGRIARAIDRIAVHLLEEAA
jgi:Flp pilus assembly CpaE family ATPase